MIRADEVAKWIIEQALGIRIVPPFCGYVAADAGFPRLAVVLNNYTGHDVHLTLTASERLRLADARDMARICFDGLNVARVTAVTRTSNVRARKGLEKAGFRWEGLLRQQFGDEDGVLYGLTRQDQRLIRTAR